MHHTYHIQQRMRQRGINQAIIQCVLDFGEIKQDKYLISQNLATNYIKQIKLELKKRHHKCTSTFRQQRSHLTRTHQHHKRGLCWKNHCVVVDFSELSNADLITLLKHMKKIADKKGVVVVMDDDTQITTYNLCSFRRIKHQTKKFRTCIRN